MESLISFLKELKYINWGYLEAYRKFTKISYRKEGKNHEYIKYHGYGMGC